MLACSVSRLLDNTFDYYSNEKETKHKRDDFGMNLKTKRAEIWGICSLS